MIDIDKYKIADNVVWVWNDYPDDEGWVLWEYKECPVGTGGYPVGSNPNKTYEPWNQVLPSLIFQCKIDERMNAITDLPLIIQEVKRLREDNKKLHDAINGCAYRGSEGSALDLYCESIIERCPTCYQNIDDMECGCEEE